MHDGFDYPPDDLPAAGSQGDVEARLQAKTRESDELAHCLDLAPACVRGLDGRVQYWGRGLEALFGWTREEMIGQPLHELLSTEFPSPVSAIEAELLSAGEWVGELVHRHREGDRLEVASHWVLHRDENGQPRSIMEYSRDVTEARRARSMIEEREARLRSILETAPDAIITINERGLIQSFSHAAEKMFGYAAGEVIGRNISLLMDDTHKRAHDDYLDRYQATGHKRIIGIGREVEAKRRDGTIFPIDLAVGEVQLRGSRLFTGFIRDLTARVRMEQDLRQAQKMEALGQLTGGIAHDFNNLLTVISGNLEMLERRVSDADGQDILREAREATELGAQLANRLLVFGRRQSLHPKLTDLNGLVSGMTDLLRRTLGGVTAIAVALAPELPLTLIDAGQAENALLNLAINARDAMSGMTRPGGGRLLITTSVVEVGRYGLEAVADLPPGPYVSLAVSDNGGGMSEEVQRRAFEPFFTTKGPGSGTGLGLSMVYSFVKQSGGHVSLTSIVGEGTTVRFYLPAAPAVAAAAPVAASAPTQAAARGETILVVEDDPRVRRVSVRRLRDLGYQVIETDGGPAALAAEESGAVFDLLFTDIAMAGGMNGVDLAHEMRRRRPGVRVLFTSGYAAPDVIEEGRMTAQAGWLAKPYRTEDLERALRALLDA